MNWTEICNKWDEWLDGWIERNIIRLMALMCLLFGTLFCLGIYVCVDTVHTVARMAVELSDLNVRVHTLQDQQRELSHEQRWIREYNPSRSYTRARTEVFEITAYSADDCGKTENHPLYGVTASGRKLTGADAYKVVAVDNHKIKFGTRMIIHHPAGPIPVIAADTGGDIQGNRLDLFVSSRDEAWKWGRKTMKVTVLE